LSLAPDDRKERVIATRVPEALDHAIRRRATSLGLSVSNLVRNVLQNSLGLVEDIVADSAEIARLARGDRQRKAPPPAALEGPVRLRCEKCTDEGTEEAGAG